MQNNKLKIISGIGIGAIMTMVLLWSGFVQAQTINSVAPLDPFVSSTTPNYTVITQRKAGTSLVLSGQPAGCAQFSATSTLKSTGVNCGSGGGGSQWTTSGSNVYYAAGNVGIGTTSPYANLGIEGTKTGTLFSVASSTDASTFQVLAGDNTQVSSSTVLSVGGIDDGLISAVGLVNINGYKYDNESTDCNINESCSLFSIHSPNQDPFWMSLFNDSVSSTVAMFQYYITSAGGMDELYNRTWSLLPSAGLTIPAITALSNENVGIGSTTPFATLSVDATTTNATPLIVGRINGASGNTLANYLVVTGAGKVGIGTTTPENTLSVQGGMSVYTSSATSTIFLDGSLGGGVITRDSAGSGCSELSSIAGVYTGKVIACPF